MLVLGTKMGASTCRTLLNLIASLSCSRPRIVSWFMDRTESRRMINLFIVSLVALVPKMPLTRGL